MRILIIDDEPDVRDIAEACLAGHTVLTAATGEEALRLAKTETPELVLLDLIMRGMSGEETLRRFVADPTLRKIPIVLLTGVDERDQIERLLEIGARGVITKPIRPATFAAEVVSAARGRSVEHEVVNGTAVVNIETIHALLDLQTDDDPTFFSDLIGGFLTDTPLRISRIHAAATADDMKTVASEAHALKSSCGNVGAEMMANAAASIEATARSGQTAGLSLHLRALETSFKTTRETLLHVSEQ